MVLSIIVLGGVGLFLQRARFGKAMRAVADNGPLASASGINTDRVVKLVWIGGSALAGLGGILYSLDQGVNVQQGQSILLLMFAGITARRPRHELRRRGRLLRPRRRHPGVDAVDPDVAEERRARWSS